MLKQAVTHHGIITATCSYHRGDALCIRVKFSGCIVEILPLSDAVDLLIDLGTVVVTLLTGTSHRELNSTGMPRSDTGNLAETFVCLTGKLLSVPTRGDTLKKKSEKRG